MWPTVSPLQRTLAALQEDGFHIKSVGKNFVKLQEGAARIVASVGRRPGSEVPQFTQGFTTMLRARARREDAIEVEKLCARINNLTVSLTSVSTADVDVGARVETSLLKASFGAALDRGAVRGPSGKPLMLLGTRKIDATQLVPYRAAIVGGAAKSLPIFAKARAEQWPSPQMPKSTGLVTAAAVERQLDSFSYFASVFGGEKMKGHGARQVELAEFIQRSTSVIVVEATLSTGLTKSALALALALATKTNGLVFDDYGVYDGSGNVVFASWTKRLAPFAPFTASGSTKLPAPAKRPKLSFTPPDGYPE